MGDVERKTQSQTMRFESTAARKRERVKTLPDMLRLLIELEISVQSSLSLQHQLFRALLFATLFAAAACSHAFRTLDGLATFPAFTAFTAFTAVTALQLGPALSTESGTCAL